MGSGEQLSPLPRPPTLSLHPSGFGLVLGMVKGSQGHVIPFSFPSSVTVRKPQEVTQVTDTSVLCMVVGGQCQRQLQLTKGSFSSQKEAMEAAVTGLP